MRRTQIYLSEKQHAALARIAKVSQQKKSEIIRAAIDSYVGRPPEQDDWKKGIMAAFGMWKDRPEVEQEILEARKSLDRDVFALRK